MCVLPSVQMICFSVMGMIRFKRIGEKLAFIWRQQRVFVSRRVLVRAFAISIAFHLAMMLLFRIQLPFALAKTSVSTPMVFLDAEEAPLSCLSQDKSDDDFYQRLSSELALLHPPFVKGRSSPFLAGLQGSFVLEGDRKLDIMPISALPWAFTDELAPSGYQTRAYPLKVMCHNELRHLELLDDGSRLFSAADYETLFHTTAFAEIRPQVEFLVDVSCKTGKITRLRCMKELVDKRFQGFSEYLLKTFRFDVAHKSHKDVLSGAITVEFAGSFDKVAQLIQWSEIHD